MRISRIYQDISLAAGQEIQLDDRAFKYMAKVLRLRQGDPLILFNGDGHDYHAVVTRLDKKSIHVTIDNMQAVENESPRHIHLGLGISKGERMDVAIQKAVELGISQITPVISEYCMVKLDTQREEKRLQHWHAVMVSACEQCGRARIPDLQPVTQLEAWLDSRHEHETKIIFSPDAKQNLKQLNPQKSITMLIGPEGGLSDQEVILAEKNNFIAVKLGGRILRTETAAIAGLTALQLLWGDLSA